MQQSTHSVVDGRDCKRCYVCLTFRPYCDFSSSRRWDGLQASCRDCQRKSNGSNGSKRFRPAVSLDSWLSRVADQDRWRFSQAPGDLVINLGSAWALIQADDADLGRLMWYATKEGSRIVPLRNGTRLRTVVVCRMMNELGLHAGERLSCSVDGDLDQWSVVDCRRRMLAVRHPLRLGIQLCRGTNGRPGSRHYILFRSHVHNHGETVVPGYSRSEHEARLAQREFIIKSYGAGADVLLSKYSLHQVDPPELPDKQTQTGVVLSIQEAIPELPGVEVERLLGCLTSDLKMR